MRHSQHVCLRVVTMRSPDHPSTVFHRDESSSEKMQLSLSLFHFARAKLTIVRKVLQHVRSIIDEIIGKIEPHLLEHLLND